MRTMTCECGYVLRGETDDDLFTEGRAHIKDVHPDLDMSDDELRGLIAANARDD